MDIHKGLVWLWALFLMSVSFITNAATLTPTTLYLLKGQSADVTVTNISGSITRIKSSDYSLFNHSQLVHGNTITVTALNKVGSGKLEVKDARGSKYVTVKVVSPMTVSPTSLTLAVSKSASLTLKNVSGAVTLSASPAGIISYSRSSNTITVRAVAAGTATLVIQDTKTTLEVPVTVTSGTGTSLLNGALLASNCYQCHGTYGSGGFDKIAGSSDLLNELQEFLSPGGDDADGIMAAHLQGYTTEQLRAISTYLSGLKY